MLNWLSSRLKHAQTDHPLGSNKAIDRYLAEIPVANPQHTLAALDDWLEAPSRLFSELPSASAAHALIRLDDFAQHAVTLCWDSYFGDGGKRDYSAEIVLKRLETHYANLAAVCDLALAALAAGDGKRDPDPNLLARLGIRAMMALTARKKIGHFAYQWPDEDWWKAAHTLLFRARDAGVLHTRQAAYPAGELSSVWREYLIALFFEVAPLANLTPQQMDALDRIVRWAQPHFICIDAFSPHTPFRIRLDENSGPVRCAPGQSDDPAWRYFGPGAAHAHLVKLRAMLSTGRAPDWLPMHCNRQENLDLAQALLQHWSMSPPKRAQDRQHQAGHLLATPGFIIARRMIAASEFARSGRSLDYGGQIKYRTLMRGDRPPEPETTETKTPLENLQLLETAGDRQMMDQWEVIDLSAQGLGARFAYRRSWQTIGALVAYRYTEEVDWHVGIVRRLGRSHGVPNVGLSIFPGVPRCAQLEALNREDEGVWQQQTRDTSGHGLIDAILVSQEARLLLLPKDIFSLERRVDLLLGGQRLALRLAGIQASGDDYDLVIFREVDA